MPNGGSSSQEDLNNLCKVGLYNVTVTDASGCSATKSIIICCCGNSNEPPTPVMCIPSTFTIQGTVIQASATQGGLININFNPPSSDYGLYWQKNGQFFSNEKNLTNLQPGDYCVYISSGCSAANKCFKIVNCDETVITISGTTNPTCVSYEEGSISLNISGNGVSPYSYNWSNGWPNKDQSQLPEGNYTVTVTDKYGCTASKTFTVGTQEITVQDQGCTRLTFCGSAVVKVQEFPSQVQFNPADCRNARIVCDNGFIGPWFFAGSTLVYGPGGPTGCLIREFCLDGSLYRDHYGIMSTSRVSGVDECGVPFCVDVSFCDYFSLGGIDPASVVIIGTGAITKEEVANCACKIATGCEGSGALASIFDFFCDEVFIGTGCGPGCFAVTGDEVIKVKATEKAFVLDYLQQQFPDFKMMDRLPISDTSRVSNAPVERKPANLGGEDFEKAINVTPNPFNNTFNVSVLREKNVEARLILSDINGKVIQEQMMQLKAGITASAIFVINETSPAGVYLLTTRFDDGQIKTVKLIKL